MEDKTGAKKTLKITAALLSILLLSSINTMIAVAAGALQWNSPYNNGVIIANAPGDISSNPVNQDLQQIVRTTDGNFVVVWADARNETDYDIYAQKINSLGVIQWTANGVPVATATGNQPYAGKISVTASNYGGTIIAWGDSRNNPEKVYIQKLDADGAPEWTSNGILLDSESINPVLLDDGSGGAYVLWENNSGGDFDIYFTHILSTGLLDGDFEPPIVLGTTGDNDYNAKIIKTETADLIITYETNDGVKKIITAVKYDPDTATEVWASPTEIESASYDVGNHDMVSDGNGGAYVAFEEQNGSDYNIYLQRIDSTGALDITGTGKSICNSTGSQTNPHLVSDNLGTPSGVIISWDDQRVGSYTDIYAQHIDGDLVSNWILNGKAISITNDNKSQSDNKIISNGANGVIIIFVDNQGTFTDIRAQHLNSAGSVLWTTGGEAIETDQTSNYTDASPSAVSAGNGDAVIAWVRQPGSGVTTDIHAQYIKDTVGSICSETNSSSFCGSQQISNYVLTFTNIPESFNFGTITTGTTSHHCNNTSTLASPADICSNSTVPDLPGADDLLTVLDERDTGGFIVQVTTQGTFTDGTNTIPLNNLYLITTIDETDPNKAGGINYSADFTGPKTVSAPLYINETTADISNPSTYTTGWGFQSAPHTSLLVSQFGGYPLDLMVGTLASTAGRVGEMSLYTNFDLKIDYDQLPGDYSLILTYDLTDSTT